MRKRDSLENKRYGKVLVLEFSHLSETNKSSYWKCICDCGYEFTTRGSSLHGESRCKFCVPQKREKGAAAITNTYHRYKQAAKKRNYEFLLTKEEFETFLFKSCHYCGDPPKNKTSYKGLNGNIEYNGIDRIDNTIGYKLENCVSCCGDCNYIKGGMNYDKFLKCVDKIHRFRTELNAN